MNRISKKIIISFLITSLLCLSLNFLYNKKEVSAQFPEEMRISCEREIPVGEAIDMTEGWAKEVKEDIDALTMAFILQEHAAKRLVKLTYPAGKPLARIAGTLYDALKNAEAVVGAKKIYDFYQAVAKIKSAIEKINEGRIGISGKDTDGDGKNDIKGLIDIYEEMRTREPNIDQYYTNIVGGIKDVYDGVKDLSDLQALDDLERGRAAPGKIIGGFGKLDSDDTVLRGLSEILEGVTDLNTALQRLDTIKGKCTEWICECDGCAKENTTYTSKETCEESTECSGRNAKCSCFEGTTGLARIEAGSSKIIKSAKDIEFILDLFVNLRDSLMRIRKGIDGVYELKNGMVELNAALDPDTRKALPDRLKEATEAALGLKGIAEPLVDAAILTMEGTQLVSSTKTDGTYSSISAPIVDGAITSLNWILGLKDKDYYLASVEQLPEGNEKKDAIRKKTSPLVSVLQSITDFIEKDIRTPAQKIRDKIPDRETLVINPLKNLWKKITGWIVFWGKDDPKSKEAEKVQTEIKQEIERQGGEVPSEGEAERGADISGLNNLGKGLEDTKNEAEKQAPEIEKNTTLLDDFFSFLEEKLEIYKLDKHFAEIQIIGLVGLEDLLDLTGLNHCSCGTTNIAGISTGINIKCPFCIPNPIFPYIPPGFCVGWACPYAQIWMMEQIISHIYKGGTDWFGPWGGEDLFFHWVMGVRGVKMPKLLLGVEGISGDLNKLIEKEYDWITPQDQLRWIDLIPPFIHWTSYDWLSWRTWQKRDWDSLTIPEGLLLTTEIAGNELQDCFVTAETIEMGGLMNWLVKCNVALDEGVLPETKLKPDQDWDCSKPGPLGDFVDPSTGARYTKYWSQTEQAKCYCYPNNYFCCK